MPPKKIDAAAAEGAGDTGMKPEDVLFLIDCLQSTTGGQVQIDCSAIAKKRNMANHRSVANRIATMKKRYGLPLATSAAKAGTKIGEAADGNNDGAVGTQASPVKRTPKKNAARKAPYNKVVKREENQGSGPSEDNTDEDRQSAIDTDEMEREVFGAPDEEENDGQQGSMALMISGNRDVV